MRRFAPTGAFGSLSGRCWRLRRYRCRIRSGSQGGARLRLFLGGLLALAVLWFAAAQSRSRWYVGIDGVGPMSQSSVRTVHSSEKNVKSSARRR